jgi:Flp pilus assembly protein TadG
MEPIRLRDERGAVIPIVVLSLIALFGMVVLTVDVGGMLTKRRAMVNAADAAALAAAQAFAFPATQAACGGATQGFAQTKANEYATKNVPTATLVSFVPDCAAQTVTVTYTTQQQLYFAPVLGFPSTNAVSATATAMWGKPKGGAMMPLELDPTITNDCVYEGGDPNNPPSTPHQCEEGFWFNNNDLTNSGWGLMNLNAWGVDYAASCDDSGGSSDLAGWITTDPILLQLVDADTNGDGLPGPTYVCTTDGARTTNWADSLAYWADQYDAWVAAGGPSDPTLTPPPSFLFPINDPALMNLGPPTSAEKYAIVGFAPMQIVDMIRVVSDTAAAVGSSYSCTTTFRFTGPGSTLDLSSATLIDAAGASSDCGHITRNQITALQLKPATGGGGNYGTPSDYAFDGKVITWKRPAANVRITFDYRNGGLCPGHAPDPNAFCLKLAWGGPTIIGSGPTLGYGPGMAIKLVK